MAERKNLLITQVNEIQKVGDRQIPKLSFKAKDGDKELTYFTFKQSLFGAIKEGETIIADVETTEQGEYTNRKVLQIYADGQPMSGKGGGSYRGKSPEELEQQARLMILAYAKDLEIAWMQTEVSQSSVKSWSFDLRKATTAVTEIADTFYAWLKGNGNAKAPEPKLKTESPTSSQAETSAPKKLGFIEGQWFRESLAKIQNNKGDAWSNDKLLNYLTKSYKVEGETVEKAVANLSQEAADHFVKKMQEALDSIDKES